MTKTPEQMEMANKLEPVTWDEIKDFYKQNFNEALPENFREAFCYAWSISRKIPVIDFLVTAFRAGYEAAELKAKIEFAAKYEHKSPLQVIAAQYVKCRGTFGPLALLEENRFIDGYEAGLHASQPKWISVKERLPEDISDVLILSKEKESCVGYYRSSDNDWNMYNPCCSFHMELHGVTHWMPLPASPEEKW